MDEKRKIQAKKDAEESKVNEAIRRKGGKDQQQLKQDLQLKEAEKAAVQRKKGTPFSLSLFHPFFREADDMEKKSIDKADELAARKRIKDQIEADKKARAEKTAREKALREGRNPDQAVEELRNPGSTLSSSSTLTPAAAVEASGSESGKKSYEGKTRLQLRVPGGAPVVVNKDAGDTLRSVEDTLRTEHGLSNVTFTCSFPRYVSRFSLHLDWRYRLICASRQTYRKTYGPSDLDKTLEQLGLCPSAVLMVASNQ